MNTRPQADSYKAAGATIEAGNFSACNRFLVYNLAQKCEKIERDTQRARQKAT
jgi:hypothetical protein